MTAELILSELDLPFRRVDLGFMRSKYGGETEKNFGATRRYIRLRDETKWLFSVDPTKMFLERSAEAKELYRSIQ